MKNVRTAGARVSHQEERHVRSAQPERGQDGARLVGGDVRDQEAQGRVHEHDPVGVRFVRLSAFAPQVLEEE